MKNILLFTFLSLMFLLVAKNMDGTLPVEEGEGVEYVLQSEVPVGYVLPLVAELPDEGVAYVDTESLARTYRVCGRSQRSFSAQQMFWTKNAAYRAAMKRLEVLCHSNHFVYTSLPCQSWEVPSDHYIFGMRRILI